jgi:hypothetical protein
MKALDAALLATLIISPVFGRRVAAHNRSSLQASSGIFCPLEPPVFPIMGWPRWFHVLGDLFGNVPLMEHAEIGMMPQGHLSAKIIPAS